MSKSVTTTVGDMSNRIHPATISPQPVPSAGGSVRYVDATITSDLVQDSERIEGARKRFHDVLKEAEVDSSPAKIAHLKGFTSGLNRDDLDSIANTMADLINGRGITTLCWDGDDWDASSFTQVLKPVQDKIPQLRVVAFLRTCEQYARYGNDAGFHGSWSDKGLRELTVILLDDQIGASDRYEHLGCIALQATQASLVIAIGGGGTLLKEYETMNAVEEQKVEYLLFDVARVEKEVETRSNLRGVDKDNVKHLSITGQVLGSGGESPGIFYFTIKILNVFGIDEMQQSFDVLIFVQMEWDLGEEKGGDEGKKARRRAPWIEWKNLLSWEEQQSSEKVVQHATGRTWTKRHVTARATFCKPFSLRSYPFDAHQLEICMVSNPPSDVVLCKPPGAEQAGSMQKDALDLLENSSWKILRSERDQDPVVTTFGKTDPKHSVTRQQYVFVSTRFCIFRRFEFTILNVVVPNFLLTLCQLMSFAIGHTEVANRLNFSLAVLLAMFAGKLVTVGMLPAVSYLTLTDWYILASYILVVAIASQVSVTSMLVQIGDVELDAGDLETIDRVSFWTFFGLWLAYHLAFLGAAIYIHRKKKREMLKWLDDGNSAEARKSVRRKAS